MKNLTKREYKNFCKGDTIWGADSNSDELKRWPIEKEAEAKAEHAKLRCEYDDRSESVFIVEYALEWCECDEDGEFLHGSNFELAEEE